MLNSFQQYVLAKRKLDVNSMKQAKGSAFSATRYKEYVQGGWRRERSPNATIRKILPPTNDVEKKPIN